MAIKLNGTTVISNTDRELSSLIINGTESGLGTPSAVGGVYTLDLSLYSRFSVSLSNDTTIGFTFSLGTAAGNTAKSFMLQFAMSGDVSNVTINWPASVKWTGGIPANTWSGTGSQPQGVPSSSLVDWYHFLTVDGGTTWYGKIASLRHPV